MTKLRSLCMKRGMRCASPKRKAPPNLPGSRGEKRKALLLRLKIIIAANRSSRCSPLLAIPCKPPKMRALSRRSARKKTASRANSRQPRKKQNAPMRSKKRKPSAPDEPTNKRQKLRLSTKRRGSAAPPRKNKERRRSQPPHRKREPAPKPSHSGNPKPKRAPMPKHNAKLRRCAPSKPSSSQRKRGGKHIKLRSRRPGPKRKSKSSARSCSRSSIKYLKRAIRRAG